MICYDRDIISVRDHLSTLNDPDSRLAYRAHRKEIVDESIKVRYPSHLYNSVEQSLTCSTQHGILCEDWAAAKQVSRSQELEDARQDRKNAYVFAKSYSH